MGILAGIGAHIVAVPLNGHDSPRAEKTDSVTNQRFRAMIEMVGWPALSRLNSVRIKGVGLVR